MARHYLPLPRCAVDGCPQPARFLQGRLALLCKVHIREKEREERAKAAALAAVEIARFPKVTQDVPARFRKPDRPSRSGDLSDMTGDQLDEAIRRFAMDHGVSITRIIRWLGADRQTSVIKRTGRVPNALATDMERLWSKPALLFDARR